MYPQTTAENIGKYGCLAMCYLYCIGIDDDAEFLRIIAKSISVGLLEEDCTVKDACKFLEYWSGRKFIVTKKPIYTIKDIKDPTPVYFKNGDLGHWVVVENGKIVFNSLKKSYSVEKGSPYSARIIAYK